MSVYDCAAVTAVGGCAAQVAASIRAGIQRLCSSSFVGLNGHPLILAQVNDQWLPPLEVSKLSTQHGRAIRLLVLALTEIAERKSVPANVEMILALPSFTAQNEEAHFRGVLTNACSSIGLSPQLEIFTGDSVAGLRALQRAGERISQGTPQILVGGAESCLDPRVLLSTRTPPLRTEESSGIVLGEGAAFVVLGPRMPNMVQISGVGIAHEPNDLAERQPRIASSLASAIQTAMEDAGPLRVSFVCSGSSGRTEDVQEFGIIQARLHTRFTEKVRVIEPVKNHGYLGPVSALVGVIVAWGGFQRKWLSGEGLILAAEHGQRGCCWISVPKTP